MYANKKGKIDCFSDKNIPLFMRDVFYVPNLRCNLLSIRKLANNDIFVTFYGKCALLKKKNIVIAVANLNGNLYQLSVVLKL